MKNEYKTMCDKCYRKTWYETEQQCHCKYLESEICNLGYKHVHDNAKEVRCTGTLRLIDNSKVNTSLVIGERYSFRDKNGLVKRFRLGKTTGWKPMLLLLHNARSTGSSLLVDANDLKYENGAYNTGIYFE